MPDAAWLPDPTGRFQYRYWDGAQWSAAVSRQGSQETDALSTQPPPPVAAAAPPPPPVGGATASPAPPPWPGTSPGWSPAPPTPWSSPSPGAASAGRADWSTALRVGVLVSAAVLLLGSCLNWVKASAGGFTVTRGGLSSDGRITLAIAIAVALIFLLASQKSLVAALTIAGGVIAAGTAFYDIGNIKHRASDLSTSTLSVTATIGIGLILCAVASVALVIAGVFCAAESRRG